MIDIDDHKSDPYMSDYMESRAQGTVTPLEQANQALVSADFHLLRATEQGDDLDKAQAQALVDRVALAAAATATASRTEQDDLAREFAKVANSEALVLSSFDYSKTA